MKILVFGKNGQVARALRQDPDVVALGRDVADLQDPEKCASVIAEHAPDAVINAAAYTAVDRAEDEIALANLINCDAPAAMAQACAARDIPFVHITTDYVFDGSGAAPRAPDAPRAPLQVYGRSKADGEDRVLETGGRFAILRTSWVFSPDGANFAKTMLRLAETRSALSIVSDQIGGPTPAAAIATACLKMARTLMEKPEKAGVYHLSGAPDVSWADFAREIFRQSGHEVDVSDIATVDYPTPARRPLNSRLDCRSLHDAFGLSRPDWREFVPAVIAASNE